MPLDSLKLVCVLYSKKGTYLFVIPDETRPLSALDKHLDGKREVGGRGERERGCV